MKPTAKKTRAAKRPAKKYSDLQSKLIGKLLDLKYRINSWKSEKGGEAVYDFDDKNWVMNRVDDVRNGETLSRGEFNKANELWKKYA